MLGAQARSTLIPCLALLALALSGCGGSDEGGATSAATATTAPSALPDELVGSYTRTLTKRDIRKAGGSLEGPPEGLPAGETGLTIEPDGVVFATHADRGDETLKFAVTSDRIEVTGGEYCEDPAASANYRWEATDEELTLTPIDNDCPDRQAVLTGTWTRE